MPMPAAHLIGGPRWYRSGAPAALGGPLEPDLLRAGEAAHPRPRNFREDAVELGLLVALLLGLPLLRPRRAGAALLLLGARHAQMAALEVVAGERRVLGHLEPALLHP